MTRKMFINAVDPEEVRIAILKDRQLEDFDIETRSVEKNKGNIYKGVVMAVEPALNAAFVNYGADKQGFLTAGDVHPKYAQPGRGEARDTGERTLSIGELLRPKQTVLVQVSKDEVGSKGAVLTTYLSLAGRYLVLMPDSATQGVSRKIDDEETRKRVREAAAKLKVPENMGVIIRTAGKDRTRLELNRDLRVLLRLWDSIQREAKEGKAPALIFKEQDVVIRALRDYFAGDIDEIIVDADEAFDRAQEYINLVMPNHRSALTRYVERRPIFHHYRIEEQLAAIYTPKVTLPSGGSVVIESTEALVAVDVNSGKQKSANQEETATETNVEAAREVARQLRLRDLGGIVVIDFIDMAARKNQQRVERALKEALTDDKARIKVGRISRNGTLELTRQRLRSALNASVFDRCHVCRGTGHVLNPASHAVAVLRRLRDRASRGDLRGVKVRVEPEVANLLRTTGWPSVQETERRYDIRIDIGAEHSFRSGQDDFAFDVDPNAVATPFTEPDFGPAARPEDFGEASGSRNIWADDEQAEADLLELEALDRQDAEQQLEEVEERKTRKKSETEPSRLGSRRVASRGRRRRELDDAGTPEHELRPAAARTASGLAPRQGTGREESLALPSYTFVDPSTLRLQRPKRGPLPMLDDTDNRGAASGGRNGRRRRRRPTDAPAPVAVMPSAAAPEDVGPKKSFWRRLLGL